ncbi:LexA family protein [Flavitalea sp.]|nr:translesion error-prone DNA polymerase V autoproteolytic subunit [Flavitalea sp.]
METSDTSIALFSNKVQAGFPSPAMDYMEERIDLNKEFIKHPLATFIVECTGDSMINAFIPPKAKLIVDRSLSPKSGDIVLAVINGEFTVKFLKKNDYNCFLIPANSKYKEIKVLPEMNMEVWGVVTSIITDTRDVKRCML